MFPRHVRWYRLSLFVLVLLMVNSDKAIAKTESDLNLDTGSGNFIACPGELINASLSDDEVLKTLLSFPNSTSGSESFFLNDTEGLDENPTCSAVALNTTCGENNGLATVIANGGVAPFSFLWSNGETTQIITDLAPGNYDVTVTDAIACTTTCAVTVAGSTIPTCSTTVTDTSCGAFDGTATVTVNNGTAPYTYAWSNGATGATASNLAPGTYTVTVTDAVACQLICMATISSSNNPTCIISGTDTSCGINNGTATVAGIGGTLPYTFLWNDGQTDQSITDLPSGVYTVTLTDGTGCQSDCSVTITSSGSPSCTIVGVDTTCGENNGEATVTVTGGVPPYVIGWSNGAIGTTITGLSAGAYSAVVIDSEGCQTGCVISIAASNSQDCALDVDCSDVTDLIVDCNTFIPAGQSLNDFIESELANCSAAIDAASSTTTGGSLTIVDNFLFTGSGANTDIIYTGFTGSGSNPDAVFITGSGSSQDIIFTISDMAGNMATCSKLVSLDLTGENIPFSITCNGSQSIALDVNGVAVVTPQAFVNQITDACHSGGPYTYEIARVVEGPCGTANDLVFEPSKEFCCEEGGTNVNVYIRVTDANGNSSSCTSTVEVQADGNNFAIVCKASQDAILEDNGYAVVAPQNFVQEIIDGCGTTGPYIYEMAKMVEGPCNIPNDVVFESGKAFCCEEIGTVTVFVRVTDANGNSASCMTTVVVKDLTPPTITSCPANMVVACSSNIDLGNLSQFGTATAIDNCNMTLVETYQDLREDCGLGDIIRNFKFTDSANNTVSCNQILTVYNDQPFSGASIVWPPDNTYTNMCNDEIPSPDVAGVPTYPVSLCNSPLVTHTDQVVPTGAGCLTVNRTWVIIDWCLFDGDADPSTYRWEHIQILTLQNNTPPVFTSCENYIESCGNELSCTGMINVSIDATDDCAEPEELDYIYTLTLEDGTIHHGVGNSINAPYPYGEHNIVWSVTDNCGNFATCAQTVKIKDCKPPTAICLSGVNINLTQVPGMDAEAVIWASDIDASSSDNCTPTSELEFAFNTDFTQTSMTFNCSNVGSHNIVLYVRDGDGNIGICKSTIQVQDNHNLCGTLVGEGDGEVLIAGRVSTQENLLMEDVNVMLENSDDPMHYMTDDNGYYAFENLPMYDNFKLVPTFEDETLNGISTADILYIQRHIIGLQKLDSPYKIIAADVNNSESVSAIDIIELRKIILGKQDEFNNSSVWRFVDSGYQFADPDSPFPYTQSTNLTQLDHSANDMNFVGVKTGDVNYSALINGFIPETLSFRSSETLSLVSSSLERGSVQLTVNKEQELSGFQLAFRCSGSLDQFNLSSSIIQIDESNFAIHDDIVKISWSSAEAITVEEGDLLFSLHFDGEIDFQLLNDLPMFNTEAYNASINPMNVEINTETKLVNNEWQVFRNTPNPFVDNTFIPFTAPSQAQLSLSVFDVNGKMLHYETRNVEQGYQKWELSATDLGNVHGVLYYRLESDDFSSTQPFIRLK